MVGGPVLLCGPGRKQLLHVHIEAHIVGLVGLGDLFILEGRKPDAIVIEDFLARLGFNLV